MATLLPSGHWLGVGLVESTHDLSGSIWARPGLPGALLV